MLIIKITPILITLLPHTIHDNGNISWQCSVISTILIYGRINSTCNSDTMSTIGNTDNMTNIYNIKNISNIGDVEIRHRNTITSSGKFSHMGNVVIKHVVDGVNDIKNMIPTVDLDHATQW